VEAWSWCLGTLVAGGASGWPAVAIRRTALPRQPWPCEATAEPEGRRISESANASQGWAARGLPGRPDVAPKVFDGMQQRSLVLELDHHLPGAASSNTFQRLGKERGCTVLGGKQQKSLEQGPWGRPGSSGFSLAQMHNVVCF